MTTALDPPFEPMAQFSGVAGDVRNPVPGFHQRDETPVRSRDGSVEIFPYDLNAAVMRDNVTFCSGSIRELMSVVMGPYPLVGMDEPSTSGCGRSSRKRSVSGCSRTGTRTSSCPSSTG